MEGLVQFNGELCKALEGEQIGDAVLRMPTLAEPLELTLLTRAQPFDSS